MSDQIERLNANPTDTIYRNDAVDALAYFDERSPTGKTAQDIIIGLPSAQPEPCEDAVSREAVSSWLKQYGQDVLHGKYKFSLMYIWKNLMDLPSAQPEIVRCKDCKHHWTFRPMGNMPTETCELEQTFYDANVDFCSLAERRTDDLQ